MPRGNKSRALSGNQDLYIFLEKLRPFLAHTVGGPGEKKNFIILFPFSLAFFFFKSFSTKDLVENLCILKQKWKAGRKGGIAKASLPIRSFKPLTSEDLLFKYTKGLLVKYAGEEYRGTLVCVALRNEAPFIRRESSPTTQKKIFPFRPPIFLAKLSFIDSSLRFVAFRIRHRFRIQSAKETTGLDSRSLVNSKPVDFASSKCDGSSLRLATWIF